MAFVEMEHGRLQAQRTDGAQAADAEDHLLPNTRGLVAAIQAIADVAIGRRVLRTVRIEQIDRHAPDLRLPHARAHVAPGDADRDRQPIAVTGANRLDRQVARVVVAILGVLNAVVVDRLLEVALPVKQAYGDEIHALVARCLAMVAGEHTQAARIDREALVESILGAEVGDQRRIGGSWRRDVIVERLQRLRITPEIGRILRRLIERLLADASKEQSRIALGLLPQLGIKVFEQRARRPVPPEKQVASQLGESRKRFRNYRNDFKYRVSHVFSAVQGRASLAARGAQPRAETAPHEFQADDSVDVAVHDIAESRVADGRHAGGITRQIQREREGLPRDRQRLSARQNSWSPQSRSRLAQRRARVRRRRTAGRQRHPVELCRSVQGRRPTPAHRLWRQSRDRRDGRQRASQPI